MTDQPKVYKKRVKLQISQVEMEAYKPSKPGISMRWYNWDPERLTVVLELIACDAMPNPTECRTMEDIDFELEKISPRIIEDNPYVEGLVRGIDVRIESNLHTPSYRNGRWDKLVDAARDVHKIKIKPADYKQVENFYNRRRAMFGGKHVIENVKRNEDKTIECDFGTVFEG